MLNNFKKNVKQLPNVIKNMAVPVIEKNLTKYFNEISKEIDKSMPEIIRNLKETFPKIQAIFHNKKKIEEFKAKFDTFFIFKKNIASSEDFDIVIKGYEIIFGNFLKVFKLQIYDKYILKYLLEHLNELKSLVHGIKRKKSSSDDYIFNLVEKIFTNYNINNLIVDFKEAMNSIKSIEKRIEKDGLGINYLFDKLKEKVDEIKEENLFTLCTQLLEYYKMVLIKY